MFVFKTKSHLAITKIIWIWNESKVPKSAKRAFAADFSYCYRHGKNTDNKEPLSALFCVNKKFCKVALSSLKSVPTPCPRSFSLLFSGAKTKRPGALELGIQLSRSMVEMITRLTMSQRSFPICNKNPLLALGQYLNRGQLPQSAIYENSFVPLAR